LFARIGYLIDKGADFLLTIKWIRGTKRSKRYRAVQAIARQISKDNRKKASSMAAAMALVAGRTWYQYLTKKLIEEVGFEQSKVDECVFYKGNVMYVLNTDDSILAGPDRAEIDQVIKQIQAAKLNITIEGDIQDILGIIIDRKEDGSIHLTQPHLIDSIVKELRLDGKQTKTKAIPAKSTVILKRHTDLAAFDGSFDYRSIIGNQTTWKGGQEPISRTLNTNTCDSRQTQRWSMVTRSNGWEDT
jgi:Reverse transcriptase (RNA-dependent DNA polymerase)